MLYLLCLNCDFDIDVKNAYNIKDSKFVELL